MNKEENKLAQEKFGDAINSGNLEQLREVVAQDVKDHDPAPNQGPGPQGYIDFFGMMRNAFPDMQVEVEHLVADEDNVAFAYTLKGTHKGDFMGVEGTNKSINVRGMQISRFRNGKMVERWGSSDELGILKQIGADVMIKK
ncbi:ester cyclase [Salinimicrobium sediminilitoris]|uniref:ester cyclase n=1 Tax=Salinimicrobium sediminilitoris TaxID=2876715 RepID=UPI001E3275E8|nr:ester cyclase [Salinimicrobium sediminilitoris]MCC8359277.1 ester cyclase [Salinimicrobium sediminilitoris]